MLIVGILLMIQGFGSGITKMVSDSNWGLLALLERATSVPGWLGLAVGFVGLVLAGLSLVGKSSSEVKDKFKKILD